MDSMASGPPLLTHTQFHHALKVEFGRARRYGVPLGCVAITLDRIGALRDELGAAARDQVLSRVLGKLLGQARSCDVFAQWGERVMVLLPHTTAEGARAVAERFRAAVASESFSFEGVARRFTASAGVAVLESKATLFFDSLPKAAETALQSALQAGGDCIAFGAGNR
jgi:diguanylate cyclase (GGDEF)-like protein